jgi:hypothetical protein
MEPNELFYGNALEASSRLCDLEQFYEYLDNYLKREEIFFKEEAHVDLEIEFLPLFANTFPPLLYSSIIISSVMLVELELRGFSDTLKEYLSLPIGISDLQGSLFDRFRKYAGALARLDMEFSASYWDDISGIYEIRNCLVHNYGSLERFSKRATIESFARKHDTPLIQNNAIHIKDSTALKSLQIVSMFFDNLYGSALRKFSGKYTWPP